MAGGAGKSSKEYVMTPVGEAGPPFRPEQDYFSVALMAVHMPPGGLFKSSKFAPVIWSSVKHLALDGERTLIGVFPAQQAERMDFAGKDRVTVVDLQLTPRIIAREQLDIDFTFGSIKVKDYLEGVLKTVGDLASSQAANFVSQIVPGAGLVANVIKGGKQTADALDKNMNAMMDGGQLQSLGRMLRTLRAPMPSGVFAFIDKNESQTGLQLDAGNALVNAKGPIKTPYAVLRLRREETRPDWMLLPDLTQAWNVIRQNVINGGDVAAAVERFRLTAMTSPDLTRADANRLTEAARQKFAAVMSGQESASIGGMESMEDALSYFMAPAEGAEIEGAQSHTSPGWFANSLGMVLRHEGGYVDYPLDAGHATNRGVTQAIYDSYQRGKKSRELGRKLSEEELKQPTHSVKELKDSELQEIYYEGYWRPARCAEMPTEAMAALMFDAAVNHGPRQAIKMLQQAAGVGDANCDGRWGPNTKTRVIAAAANAVGLVDSCLLKRERFYRQIVTLNPSQSAFLRGWMNRLASLRGYLNPLLAKAPPGGETESALLTEGDEHVLLRAAPPDFSQWLNASGSHDAVAAQ